MQNPVECINQINQYLPAISALGGACIGGAILLVNNIVNIKSNEKKL